MATIACPGTGLQGRAFAQVAAKRGDHVSAWNSSADRVTGSETVPARG